MHHWPESQFRNQESSRAPIPGRPQEPGQGQVPIHFFKEETISLCHAEPMRFAQGKLREGALAGQRSFASLRMTMLNRLRLTRNSSYLGVVNWTNIS